MRRPAVLVLLACVSLAAYLLWPKATRSPEQEVRELIASCIRAAEKREVGPIAEALADDFVGPGGASKQEIRQLVLGHLLRSQGGVLVLNPSLTVTLQRPDAATFQGTFIFGRGAGGSSQDDSLGKYEIEAQLQRRGDSWLVVRASWQR